MNSRYIETFRGKFPDYNGWGVLLKAKNLRVRLAYDNEHGIARTITASAWHRYTGRGVRSFIRL